MPTPVGKLVAVGTVDVGGRVDVVLGLTQPGGLYKATLDLLTKSYAQIPGGNRLTHNNRL